MVQMGANLEAVDSNGNTILHLCVHHSLEDMYSFVLDLWKRKQVKDDGNASPLDKRINLAGLTPFTYAASTSNAKVFI